MMILVEHTEGEMATWHIWNVSRAEKAKILTILPSHATYYHADRGVKREKGSGVE